MTEQSREPTEGVDDKEIARRDILNVRQSIFLGAEVHRFMEGDAGRALQARCATDMEAALEKLAMHDAHDAAGIAKLQLEYRTAAGVLHYMGVLVSEGETAEQNFAAADSQAGDSQINPGE